MTTTRRKTQFSLSTICLLMVIAASVMSNVVMVRKLQEARTEIESVRREFGYIRIGEETGLIHISRIEKSEGRGKNYRMYIPPGHRFLLHIADTEITDDGCPENPKPTKTLSMNPWRDGAEVVLAWGVARDDDGTPRFWATTDSEQLFNYRLENWKDSRLPNSGMDLRTGPQKSFRPDEKTLFMWFANTTTKRGIMFWMESIPEGRDYKWTP